MSIVYVIGGTVSQAREYCQKNDLGFGKGVIVTGADNLRGTKKAQVHLIGSFHSRGDAETIKSVLKLRNAEVTDLTDNF